MTLPVQGLGSALCSLDPGHVAWARAAAQRLGGLGSGGFDVTIAAERSDAGRWYRGEHFAFQPQREPLLPGAPAAEQVRILSAHEDVLGEIEQALGHAAEFAHFAFLPDDWPVLSLSRHGQAIGRLAVLTEITAPAEPRAPVVMPLAFVAARLPLAEAEKLEPGDMLLLSHGPWRLAHQDAGTSSADAGAALLGYDPASGRLAPILVDPVQPSSGASFTMTSNDKIDGLNVPVAVHLADIAVSQDQLARMAETGTFDLGAVSEGLSATLSVGGRGIGRGEIVRLGDRFAVLLEKPERAAADQGTAETSTAEASTSDQAA